ncbi:PQQ-dependent sugar dehydrogenase [Lentiprolixibacter aurantiacus]|uniref:PQQ-dependent sugar dehydrogenase n=1 Tax=Lentiprolixibacter aurantiacus TaxID=2993939 RepID=A0AAE3MLC9_9FLAO|nr:PQQ-dependent sugar dehydrogenase [Lentiprolixibacter aurantiacus]MCX2719876.1 PQQ-dependent sugar dehydrogenase [Lentiprolixibacter aurantiacus]
MTPLFKKNKPKLIILSFLLFSIGQISFGQISYEPAFPDIRFNLPVEIQSPPDGTDRLFVVEQPGRIKVFPNVSTVQNSQVTTFLDISSQVYFSSGQEIGLLGLAFHPNYSSNGYFYIYYTILGSNNRINMVLSEFSVSGSDNNLANPSSEKVLFQFEKNQFNSNHNGGKIAFGPDGHLYISIGDGGGAGDPQGNGQNLDTAFGSILRIDVDLDGNNPVETNPDLPNGNYEIPSDNPRLGLSGLDELYAWGIRNTWKFSFDFTTNRLWGADVGQGDFEEINLITLGGNYGWNRFEGTSLETASTTLVTTPDIKPIFEYDHSANDVSITGGYVYRGALTDPLLQGKYIFGDYVSGRVWSLDYDEATQTANRTELFRTSGQFISSFGLDQAGDLYFSDYGSSVQLYRITGQGGGPTTVPVEGVGDWAAIGSGINGTVETICMGPDNTYYIGGTFTQAGGINASNIVIYDQEGYRAFGAGANGKVASIALAPDGTLYVGGEFTQIGGISASNIASWDGNTWSALGSGTNGPVAKINIDPNGLVYVGGVFETAGGIIANNIALWDNGSWSALVDATNAVAGTNNEIRAIAFDENNNVLVGGNFDSAGGNPAPRIAIWDGTNWDTFGAGTSGFVQAIVVDNNYIYAGGNFSIAGGTTVNRIARWDRNLNTWEALNFGLSGNVNAMAQRSGFLYVGGSFETASDTENVNEIMNNVVRWSEASGWEALGPGFDVGVDTRINALRFSEDNSQLYVGGTFNTAGDKSASNIAIWSTLSDCNAQSVIPEYQINGVWQNGDTEITVLEGDLLIIGMLPNEIEFTVSAPGGGVTNGDLNLGAVNEQDAGVYTITSTFGCTATLTVNVTLADSDNDGVPDSTDLCPDTPVGETVNADGCAESQLDDDNDGVTNDLDLCPNTSNGETVDANGCAQSQLDDDNDGVTNNLDLCPNTPNGETVDASGCSQSQLDDDNDGVTNDLDLCPNTPNGETVNIDGCAQSQLDDDNDGVSNDLDLCPNTPNGEAVDANGCSQTQLDDDNDGVNNAVDQCPNTPAGATVDQFGCEAGQTDGDNDGVPNTLDLCPNTPNGETVDANGCSQGQLDDDNDGVTNDLDLCPNTPNGASVNADGCAQSQLDDDNDGVTNDLDLCPNTPNGEEVDANGCSQSQIDDDNDGVPNTSDQCPNTPEGIPVDNKGCAALPVDNFIIQTQGTSCENLSDGIITVEANLNLNYQLSILFNGIEDNYTFNSIFQISDLAAGTYELCISLPGTAFERCFTAVIMGAEPLSVFTNVDANGQILRVSMDGSNQYTVNLNGNIWQTGESVLLLNLEEGLNSLKISTNLPCQGIFEETFLSGEFLRVSPNPFEGNLNLLLGNPTSNLRISIYSSSGQLVKRFIYAEANREIGLFLGYLNNGMYYLVAESENFTKSVKLIKR